MGLGVRAFEFFGQPIVSNPMGEWSRIEADNITASTSDCRHDEDANSTP